jgi:6-pyruvoyltetrahydropterin/6-carboxytetrahydropterin synthase
MYRVIKKYGHAEGLSCAFRQWRSEHSHCKFIHGYALAFEICFVSQDLTPQNWVIDFGGLKALKEFLKQTFDHKLAIAEDDPKLQELLQLQNLGLAQVVVMPSVGCEKFAELVGQWIISNVLNNDRIVKAQNLQLEYVKVLEHEGNSAVWSPTTHLEMKDI